jgi:hypothetical protein
MRSIPVIAAALFAMGSTAVAQLVVTPQTPLGQGFAPNGTQNTPSNPNGNNTLQPYQGLQPSNQSVSTDQPGGSTQSGLNWLYAPNPSGRTLPQGPIGGAEHPTGPLR